MIFVLLMLLLLPTTGLAQIAPEQVLDIRQIGDLRISPDGRQVALAVYRAGERDRTQHGYLFAGYRFPSDTPDHVFRQSRELPALEAGWARAGLPLGPRRK